jgi:alkaline phosphatase D
VPSALARRRFLAQAAALAASPWLQACAGRAERPSFASDPFTLGVASGSPREESVVLWTRLAPRPLEGGGLDPVPLAVHWEVAHDEGFQRIARDGDAIASPDAAHSVHVEVERLEPGRDYFYRFRSGDATSPVARTRTAPRAGRGDERLRFAFGSCQQYEQGFFVAHRHLADEHPDLVLFLGDYIYESSWGRDFVRHHDGPAPRTLAEYRNRYAQYKTDRDLQRAHAVAPWIVTWDDHEVENDYADDRSETLDPDFLARRTAAYRAFFEHMPLRLPVLAAGGGMRIYDRFAWGALAEFHVIDDRQYRAHEACPKPGRGGSNVVTDAECGERLDPARTMLGREQEAWLDQGFARSRAAWNVLAQQTLMAPAGTPTAQGLVHWTDGWDGYPAARARLLESMSRHRLANPVVIGGDVHAQYFADLHLVPDDPRSPVVASELCGTSITSQGPGKYTMEQRLGANPWLRYGEGSLRGYTLVEATRDGLDAHLRAVQSVKHADSGVRTAKSVHVEAGQPGIA